MTPVGAVTSTAGARLEVSSTPASANIAPAASTRSRQDRGRVLGSDGRGTGVAAGQRQHLLDPSVEPIHLGGGGVRLRLDLLLVGDVLDGLEAQPHSRQRCPQVMRRVRRDALRALQDAREPLALWS